MITITTIRDIVIKAWNLSGEDGLIGKLNFLNQSDNRSAKYTTFFYQGIATVLQDCLLNSIMPNNLMMADDITGTLQTDGMSFILPNCFVVEKVKDLKSNKYVRKCNNKFDLLEAKDQVYLKKEMSDELITKNTSDSLRVGYVTDKFYQGNDLSDPVSIPTTPDMNVLLDAVLLTSKIGANYSIVMGGEANMVRQQKFEADYVNRIKALQFDNEFIISFET